MNLAIEQKQNQINGRSRQDWQDAHGSRSVCGGNTWVQASYLQAENRNFQYGDSLLCSFSADQPGTVIRSSPLAQRRPACLLPSSSSHAPLPGPSFWESPGCLPYSHLQRPWTLGSHDIWECRIITKGQTCTCLVAFLWVFSCFNISPEQHVCSISWLALVVS